MTVRDPWLDELAQLDATEIRSRVEVKPKRLNGLDKIPVHSAKMKLEKAFDELFVPTEQIINHIQSIIGISLGHLMSAYHDTNSIMSGNYAKNPPLPDSVVPTLITGLAGAGKTALVKAVFRALPHPSKIRIDEYHPPFERQPGWFVDIKEKTTLSAILSALLGEDVEELDDAESEKKPKRKKRDIDKLRNRCRHKAYILWVLLLIADEFQYLTRSDNANAMVSKILMLLSTLGVPFIYVANYSLIHRLAKRPQEDRQRLLSDPIVLLPDDPESKDWVDTLKAYRNIAPGVFRFDPVKDAITIYKWTAGIKRLLKILLSIAYKRSRYLNSTVNITVLQWAFLSPEYSIHRQDILKLHEMYLTGKCDQNRKDLWCPIELPASVASRYKIMAEYENKRDLVACMVQGSMTTEERTILEELQQAALQGESAPVISLSKKRQKASHNFLRGEKILTETLNKDNPN